MASEEEAEVDAESWTSMSSLREVLRRFLETGPVDGDDAVVGFAGGETHGRR